MEAIALILTLCQERGCFLTEYKNVTTITVCLGSVNPKQIYTVARNGKLLLVIEGECVAI